MPFKEMQFKGNRVFIEVDEYGKAVLEKDRARMKYRLEDDRIYSPNISNLKELSEESVPNKEYNTNTDQNLSRPVKTDGKNTNVSESDSKNTIIAYTDGACSGNPGPAGLGYVISYPDGTRIEKGEPLGRATNNIAELTAILRVLETVIDSQAKIIIHTDSSYSIGVLTENWKAKANVELIHTLRIMLRKYRHATLKKVKGHAGIPDNEMVDKLARKAAEMQQIVGSSDI
jgi:ribonuclease HI